MSLFEKKQRAVVEHKASRNHNVDMLKAVAIIAVILYHLGNDILPFGYLGVDIFFVISGYFLMAGMEKERQQGKNHRYFYTLFTRIKRLWLPILLVCLVSLSVGYFLMLPDDFENLSQSVVASSTFTNNILACITTKNYWDVVNQTKPMMHLWYAGVLMQAYVVIPIILMVVLRFCKRNVWKIVSICGILLAGMLLYLLPIGTEAEKFYYLPFRLFEFFAGVLTATIAKQKFKLNEKINVVLSVLASLVIVLLLCTRTVIISAQMMLIATVVCTAILLILFENGRQYDGRFVRLVAGVGQASFSLYLWHQVLIAFLNYCAYQKLTIEWGMIFAVAIIILAYLSYRWLEKPLNKANGRRMVIVISLSGVLCVVLCALGLVGYIRGGVVRDVPELGITVADATRGMHAKYNDRVYEWNRDFTEEDTVKVLVVGDSFGRDFANILSETSFASEIEISYIYPSNNSATMSKYSERIYAADVIFYAPSGGFKQLPQWLTSSLPVDEIYVVGTKNYGVSNGYVYARRFTENYYNMTVEIDDSFWERNEQQKAQYGKYYIDLLEPVRDENGNVCVFTDDGKLISQDCRHLTRFGAIYYAKILDLSWIVDLG